MAATFEGVGVRRPAAWIAQLRDNRDSTVMFHWNSASGTAAPEGKLTAPDVHDVRWR